MKISRQKQHQEKGFIWHKVQGRPLQERSGQQELGRWLVTLHPQSRSRQINASWCSALSPTLYNPGDHVGEGGGRGPSQYLPGCMSVVHYVCAHD